MAHDKTSDIIAAWPQESQEAARLVIAEHGEPDEATASALTWRDRGPWMKIVATRESSAHDFPAPHSDSVESFIQYKVPLENLVDVGEFDGSITVRRTQGLVSARCHDLQANNLALNLMHDIVAGEKTVDEAREAYAQEFLAHRRHDATPYMDRLRTPVHIGAPFRDVRALSDEELEEAARQGRRKAA